MPISIGDVLLASAKLKPRDEKTRAMLLGLLGFEVAPRVQPASPVGPWKSMTGAAPAPDGPALVPPPSPPRIATTGARLEGAGASSTWIGKATFAAPQWSQEQTEPFRPAAGSADSLPPPALFERPRVRALLTAALGTFRDGREIDVDHVVRIVSGGARLEQIPYRPVLTLRRGAQLLVDRSTAMDPYSHDVAHVLADLRTLFGRGHIEVLEFAHCPSRGVRSTRARRRERWQSPGRGVPVLVVSDLGLGPSIDGDDFATGAEWLAFARMVHDSGCPMTALVPVPPARWPPVLARAMAFVFWSERTTVRQVVKAVRESHRATERFA